MTEPVFVFGSNIAGRHLGAAGTFAVEFHGAVEGQGFGLHGNSYAIPTQNSKFMPLPPDVIKNYVGIFFKYASEHNQKTFQIIRVGCGCAGYKDEQMAPLFKKAGANCLLPGVWQRMLNRNLTPRIILLDPAALLKQPAAQKSLDQYFSLNLPLWDARMVEIVSVGQARSLVANDAYARKCGYQHRIINANAGFYGKKADQVRDANAVWYATHLLWIVDAEQTTTRRRARLISMADRRGLMIDEVMVGRGAEVA